MCLAVAAAAAEPASRLYREAQRAEREGRDLEAFLLLTRAAGLRPQEQKYTLALERVRRRASQSLAALQQLDQALELDPDNSYLRGLSRDLDPAEEEEETDDAEPPPTFTEMRQAELAAPPVELRPAQEQRSFQVTAEPKTLWEQVAGAYGLGVVFDPEWTPGPPSRLRLDQADFREAIRALMALTNTFVVPLRPRMLLVAADTQQKRTELDPTMATLLPIPQAISVEEANEIGRAVQQVLDIKRLAVDAARRQVYLRDTVSRVQLARVLYLELARRRAEVMIDIDLVSASSSTLTNLGLSMPTSFPITSQGTVTLGSGRPQLGISIGDFQLAADESRSQARLLSSVRLRATDGLPASMHIGDRFPILNAIFSPIVFTDQIRDLQQSGQYRQPFPSFTFEDLGLVLKVTPRVHDRRDVTLTLEAEFKLLAGPSYNGIPVISTRKFSSTVRLREGESGLVSGMAAVQISKTAGGLPGIGRLVGRRNWQRDESELILAITPRLTVLPPAEQGPSRAFYTGSDSRLPPPI